MCVADVLEEEIESNLLMGIVSFDATLGIRLGPRSPTSLMGLLYRFSGEFNGQQGAQIFPVGGMEQLIKSFYASVESSGVTTLFNQTVKNFIIKAWCKCWENGKLVHSKDWDYSVARNGM